MKTIDEVKTPVSLQYEMEVEDINTLENLLKEELTPLQQQIFNLVTHEGLIMSRLPKSCQCRLSL